MKSSQAGASSYPMCLEAILEVSEEISSLETQLDSHTEQSGVSMMSKTFFCLGRGTCLDSAGLFACHQGPN